MSRERERIARLQTAARRALAEGELELYFQPIVGSGCDYPAAVETLLRRRLGDGSVQSMGAALAYLERSSTIVEIDEFVLGGVPPVARMAG